MEKNLKMNFLLLPVIAALLMASCGRSLYYNYNYVRYDTPESALEAQKKHLEMMTRSITALETPVRSSITVVIPSKTYLKRNVIVWKGAETSSEVKEKALDFHATIIDNEFNAMANMLEKRRVFDKVAVINSDDPENAPFSEEIALKLYKKDHRLLWFIFRKETDESQAITPIEEVPVSLPPPMRINLWLERVENAAKGGQ